MTVADRIAVMNHGRIAQVATPAEIYEYPKSRYVADFVGDVNLIEGRVESRKGDLVRILAPDLDGPLVLRETREDAVLPQVGATAWVALRPEKLRIVPVDPGDAGAGDENTALGAVWDIAYLGDLSIYHVRLPSGRVLKVAQANRTRLVERPIGWEDPVRLSWARDGGVVLPE